MQSIQEEEVGSEKRDTLKVEPKVIYGNASSQSKPSQVSKKTVVKQSLHKSYQSSAQKEVVERKAGEDKRRRSSCVGLGPSAEDKSKSLQVVSRNSQKIVNDTTQASTVST
mmetsp:Transcript_33487/g.32546  ORF Transcript_33487/g.32546 Transcript_33487/m.32546 type:complete len:111 (-) Transcript_33487:51-383(-)